MPGALAKLPATTNWEGAVAFGLAFTPTGLPKPPTLVLGAVVLLATGVGVALANRPTFGCGGGATCFGGAGGTTGIGTLIFTSGFGGSTFVSSCFGSTIFGLSRVGGSGGGMNFTFGTGGGETLGGALGI